MKTMPNNLEAEQGVLSCILIDNENTISAFSLLSEEDFYSPSHKIIFGAMRSTFEKGTPVDFVTLTAALENTGCVEKVGGIAYVTTIADMVPSSANFSHYLRLLKECTTRRKLIDAANKIIEQSYITEDSNAALTSAEKRIFDISREGERRELMPFSSDLAAVISKLDEIQRNPASVRGLPSGLFSLDYILNGFQKSDLVIIAARPSVGKTVLGLNIALNAALKMKAKVAVFSLEMSRESLVQRALFSLAKVNSQKAIKGELEKEDWTRIWESQKHLANCHIFGDDNSVITPAEISRKCMRLKREHGLDLVMIDYLGLMTGGSGGRRESRQVEVSDNSRMMKIMAKELGVPVLLLSQLNRGIESRKGADSRPMLSDLRESGAIEQDADVVIFIHREKASDDAAPLPPNAVQETELIVAKHRNGPTGIAKVGWRGDIGSFVNISSGQE